MRQETLCGWRYQHQFEQIRDLLAAFPDKAVARQEYELAAEYFNLCRSKGIQGRHTDFLLCACSDSWNMPLLTKDADFTRYAKYVPVKLYKLDEPQPHLNPSRPRRLYPRPARGA